MRERKIVLLIDAENTSARYAKRIVDYLEKRGDIICARIYGDFINNVSVKGWNSVAIEYEMEQKQQLTTSAGKNSSDIALVIDAMDLLYQKNIDTLCIVTSDGDFTGLVKRIREDGIEVIGIGKSDASKRLEKVCDQFLDFEELEEERSTEKQGKYTGKKEEMQSVKGRNAAEKKVEAKRPVERDNGEAGLKKVVKKKEDSLQNNGNSERVRKVGTKKAVWGEERRTGKQQTERISEKKQEKKENTRVQKNNGLNQTERRYSSTKKQRLGDIKTAIHEIVQQEEKKGKHAELGGIKSQLQMKYPDFDERDFGYKTIRDLINEETKFQVVLEGRHTYVVPEKAVPIKQAAGDTDANLIAAEKNSNEENGNLKKEKVKKKKGFSIKEFIPRKK